MQTITYSNYPEFEFLLDTNSCSVYDVTTETEYEIDFGGSLAEKTFTDRYYVLKAITDEDDIVVDNEFVGWSFGSTSLLNADKAEICSVFDLIRNYNK